MHYTTVFKRSTADKSYSHVVWLPSKEQVTKCSYHKCLNMSSISVDIVSKETLFSLFNCLFLFFVLWMCSLIGLFFPFKMDDRRIFSQFYLQKSLFGRFSVWIFHEEVVFLRILQGFNSFLRLSFYNYLIKGQYLKLQHFHCLFSLRQWLHQLRCLSYFLLFTGISFYQYVQ